MSFFGGGNGRSHSDSDRLRVNSHHKSTSHSRGHSPARSTTSGYYARPSISRSSSSFFGNFGGSGSRGIFGSGGSSSYYKRRPRDGYISYLMNKLQRMVKELWYYARRHPMKAFFAIVVPLLSAGGAIHGLLRQFNVRVPGLDGATRYSRGSGGYYGSSGYGSSGGGGWMNNMGGIMQVAKAFM